MRQFSFEYARIEAAIRQIARLRRQRSAAGDAAVRRAFDYEIHEMQKQVDLIRLHIEREMRGDRARL